MTQSSERLTGDWEARIQVNARPIAWSRVARHLVECGALVCVIVAAVFGFR